MKFSKWLLYLRVFGGKAAQFLVFLALAALNLIPFLWGFITSLKSAREVLAYPPQISGFAVSWEHYANIIASGFLQSLKVSTFYCFSAIGIGLLLGLMIAYSLKRYQYKGRKLIFYLVLCAIPLSSGSAAMVVPNYVFFTEIGFSNQWYTMPILYTAYNLPMAIWIIMGGIEGIPLAIEESMIIDGANRLYLIFNMTIRLCLPSLSAAALFIFIGAWNDYVVGSVMVNSTYLKPIQVSVYNFLGYYGREWGPLSASATAAVLPILVVFAFLGRLLISGMTQGAVKE